jgi:hypothetical protein
VCTRVKRVDSKELEKREENKNQCTQRLQK